MSATVRPGDLVALTDQVTALGGRLPAELAVITDAIAAVNAWAPPQPTDIASLCRRGELTATNAGDILDSALVQPNRQPADLKVTAKHELAQRFAALVAGTAGDKIIESIRPAFDTACTAIAAAADIVPAGATVADLADADDRFIQAWRDPRAGRWHQIASAITLNTVTRAREILTQAETEYREHQAAEHARTHRVLTG
ncbi:hypothetical protein ABLE92_24455 [Gordonia sp. VNQ95]|uniref:hypothetical protein n=1 Tax=Gordonia sp. VNQ95 TaxID=3156619 RepID=UPI0032B5F0D4